MQRLQLDIETYSDINLLTHGVAPYVESSAAELLLFSYKCDNLPTRCVDLYHGEIVPIKILYAIADETVLKTAFNAPFELCWLVKWWKQLWAPHVKNGEINAKYIPELKPQQWLCTQARVASLSLPLSLESVGEALKLTTKKDKRGKALIALFCVPCKPTKRNNYRTRNLPEHFPDEWEEFKAYNIQDVEVEAAVINKIESIDFMTPREHRLRWLDYRINTRGIMLDHDFIQTVIKIDREYRAELFEEAIELTALENPNSLPQLKKWLSQEYDEDIKTLNKKEVKRLLALPETSEIIERVLEIRKELAKTSVSKYVAMIRGRCKDGRIRNTLQIYGAGRTGRWAGRQLQTHNLPKNEMSKSSLALARKIVSTGDLSLIKLCYANVQYVLSQLIRTALIAPKNSRFLVGDFAAIEARIIAWLAGEKWRQKAFRQGRDIYVESASRMFKIPYEQIMAEGKESPYRFRGKIAELALGYQGAYGAMLTMGALEMGIPEYEIDGIVSAWRAENPAIVNLWYTVERAAKRVIQTGVSETLMHGIKMVREKGQFFIILPSGRRLTYLRPQMKINKFGKLGIEYEGLNDKRKNKHKWGYVDTYGGKLVENIVQAIARDVLAEAMLRIDKAGYDIVFHVHDEIVCECPNDFGSCEEFNEIMSVQPKWADGLLLKVESFETYYYQK
jgi:DNA polymerase